MPWHDHFYAAARALGGNVATNDQIRCNVNVDAAANPINDDRMLHYWSCEAIETGLPRDPVRRQFENHHSVFRDVAAHANTPVDPRNNSKCRWNNGNDDCFPRGAYDFLDVPSLSPNGYADRRTTWSSPPDPPGEPAHENTLWGAVYHRGIEGAVSQYWRDTSRLSYISTGSFASEWGDTWNGERFGMQFECYWPAEQFFEAAASKKWKMGRLYRDRLGPHDDNRFLDLRVLSFNSERWSFSPDFGNYNGRGAYPSNANPCLLFKSEVADEWVRINYFYDNINRIQKLEVMRVRDKLQLFFFERTLTTQQMTLYDTDGVTRVNGVRALTINEQSSSRANFDPNAPEPPTFTGFRGFMLAHEEIPMDVTEPPPPQPTPGPKTIHIWDQANVQRPVLRMHTTTADGQSRQIARIRDRNGNVIWLPSTAPPPPVRPDNWQDLKAQDDELLAAQDDEILQGHSFQMLAQDDEQLVAQDDERLITQEQ